MPRAYEPRELLADVVDQLAHAAGAKRLEIAASTAVEVLHTLVGDAGRLRQVLRQLLAASAEGSIDGAPATVRDKRVGKVAERGGS